MPNPIIDPIQKLARPFVVRANPLPVPDVADITAEPNNCITLNATWVSHVLGVLEALNQPDSWAGTDEQILATLEQIEILLEMAATGECTGDTMEYPELAVLWPEHSIQLTGSYLEPTHNASQDYAMYCDFNSVAQNNAVQWLGIPLKAGSYQIVLVVRRAAGSGICSWKIDGVLQGGTQDLYRSSSQYNYRASSYGMEVLADGAHDIELHMLTKNPSASNYQANISQIWLRLSR